MEKTWSDLTPYEVERQRTIAANNKKLEALNIPRLSQSIQKSSSTKKDKMRFVRPGDLQVAANNKRLRSHDIPKPPPPVIIPSSSASQDAPPSSPTHDATSHRLTKKGRPKRSQPPHFQFQPQYQHQPSPPSSPPQHQPSPPPPQHQPPPPPPQHQPSPPQPQHQSSEPEHEVVLERLSQPRQPLPPPPPRNHAHWIVDVIDDDGNVRQKSVEVNDLIPNKVGFKVQTIWNDDHQPIGEAGGLLSGYIGFLASSDELLPIMYPKWPKVPLAKKDLIYDNNIKAKFVVSDTNKFHKKWIYTSLGKRWRERRCFLFNKYYDWALTVEQNIEQFPPEVTKDHWAMYLNYRLSPDTMAKADKNALNRQKQRIPHTLGTRSLARTRDIMEQRDGRSYSRGDMYEISHTKRNGSYVNDEARQKNEELQKERQTSSDNEAFVTVFGKEHHGYVRGMGLGPTPSQNNGSSSRPSVSTSSSTADAKIAKMQSEIDVLTKEVAEVNELKAKVAEFDAMKEQFALIMANMQNQGYNIGSPFEVRRSFESSHNVEGNQATPDDST
ncbi:uncharacterized protein LOC123883810 [Trifolium pratense]|uniref:uncharacterized protein LOC123883810 n=1 Tax=Trifolium pratense TaxID=57577 RepID=UPI001E693103|nr:uncharacterized protein LOC123883810 [Trifolium pratense]